MVDNSLPISPLLDKSSFRVQFGFLIKSLDHTERCSSLKAKNFPAAGFS